MSEHELQPGFKIVFAAWYMQMGEIQLAPGKDGLRIVSGEITKVKNGLIFYKLEDETGERKCSISAIGAMRDFGTSIYGIFNGSVDEINKNVIIDSVIEVLEKRVLGAMQAKSSLICLMENRR